MARDDALHNLWAEKAAGGDSEALEKLFSAVKGLLWHFVLSLKDVRTTLTFSELMAFALQCVPEACAHYRAHQGANFEALLMGRVKKRLDSRIINEAHTAWNRRIVSESQEFDDGDHFSLYDRSSPHGPKLKQPHANTYKSHCPNGHEYTPQNTRSRKVIAQGRVYEYRHCRECERKRQRSRNEHYQQRRRERQRLAYAKKISLRTA